MSKNFDVKKTVKEMSDKNKLFAAAAAIIYQAFVAGKISNKYLAAVSTAIVPAVLGPFIVKDKKAAGFFATAGITLGLFVLAKIVLQDLAMKETDPKKRATYIQYASALGGGSPEMVSGVSYPVYIQESGYPVVEYQAPANTGIRAEARNSDTGSY